MDKSAQGADTGAMDDPIEIDTRGMLCPLPVLRLRKRLEALPPGSLVELAATDRASWIDVPHFCAGAGHELIAMREVAGVLYYRIRRGEN